MPPAQGWAIPDRTVRALLPLLLLAIASCDATTAVQVDLAAPTSAPPSRTLLVATTTTVRDSGILDPLVARFRAETGLALKAIAVGSGAALTMGARGDADVVLTHSPDAEAKLVATGELIAGRLVMTNDFVLVGPPGDPAGVASAVNLAAAMRALAATGGFVSRGDESGTHVKELALWHAAGIDPATVPRRAETGQGMGATLEIADQRSSYALTDRATLAVHAPRMRLAIVREGASELANPYHAYAVNPARHPGVLAIPAQRFLDFLVAPTTQAFIADFGRAEYGDALFTAALPPPR